MSDSKFEEILKYGTYYYPANKHYSGKGSVGCDRCKKTKLTSCIGYEQMDLCLICADELSNPSTIPEESPKYINDPTDKVDMMTLMCSSIYEEY